MTVFLQSLFRNLSGAVHPHFANCVCILLYSQNDVDPEVSKTAKAGLALAAQVIASPPEVRLDQLFVSPLIDQFLLLLFF